MFEKALTYPTDGDHAVKTLAIGVVLSLLSFLILPAFLVFGYFIRVLRQGSDETALPPAYDDWGSLLVDGLKAFVVSFGYFAVPVGLIIAALLAFVPVATFTVVESTVTGGGIDAAAGAQTGGIDAFATIALVIGLLLAITSFVTLLAVFYVLPAGLARFASTGRMGSAFAIRRLWPVLTTGHYAIAWVLALAVSIAAGIVVGFVSFVPVLGFVAGVAVTYYGNVVAFRLYGQGYANATPVEDSSEPLVGQPAA